MKKKIVSIPMRMRKLQEGATELANWYRKHLPSNTVIHVSAADYRRIKKLEGDARAYGFAVTMDGIFFSGYLVLPVHDEPAPLPSHATAINPDRTESATDE